MAHATEGNVAVSCHTLQPGEVMADALIRLLSHGEELLKIDHSVLVLEHKLFHPPEQCGLVKSEMLAPRDPRQDCGQLAHIRPSPLRLYVLVLVLVPGYMDICPFFTFLINT